MKAPCGLVPKDPTHGGAFPISHITRNCQKEDFILTIRVLHNHRHHWCAGVPPPCEMVDALANPERCPHCGH